MGQKVTKLDPFYNDNRFLLKTQKELIYYKGLLIIDADLLALESKELKTRGAYESFVNSILKVDSWNEMMEKIKIWILTNSGNEFESRIKYILNREPNWDMMFVVEAMFK